MTGELRKRLKDELRPYYRQLKRLVEKGRRPFRLRKIPPIASIDPAKPLYVFFVPEAFVEPHLVAHAIIARTLKDLGHQVLLVHCESDYPHCMPMEMSRLTATKSAGQKQNVCDRCNTNWLRVAAAYRLPSISISQLIGPDTKDEIRRLVAQMSANAGEFEVDGFKFGALCGSDLALTRKVLRQMEATGENRALLEFFVEGALIAYRAIQSIAKRYSIGRILYFQEYSMLMGASVAAQRAGIPITRLSHAIYNNVDRSRIMLGSEPLAIYSYHRLLDEWECWRDLALPPILVKSIGDHTLQRLAGGGFTVYSPQHGSNTEELYRQLELDPHKALLVAFPSSMDEYYANIQLTGALGKTIFPTDQPFQDQTAWLQALIDHVEASRDLQLVVRIHPREGRNILEDRESEHLFHLKQNFSHDYRNVRIVWPEEAISSYDLAEMADVALTGWSNIGLELARMGIPTLIAFKRYVAFPLGDVVDWEPTPEAYFSRLRELITTPASINRIAYSYRWTNVYSLALSLEFDDLIPSPDMTTLPTYRRPHVAPLVEKIIVEGASVTEINRQSLLKDQSETSDAAEKAALRIALRKLIWFLATNEISDKDYRVTKDAPVGDGEVNIAVDGPTITLRTPHKSVVRRSKVIQRLAPLAFPEQTFDASP